MNQAGGAFSSMLARGLSGDLSGDAMEPGEQDHISSTAEAPLLQANDGVDVRTSSCFCSLSEDACRRSGGSKEPSMGTAREGSGGESCGCWQGGTSASAAVEEPVLLHKRSTCSPS